MSNLTPCGLLSDAPPPRDLETVRAARKQAQEDIMEMLGGGYKNKPMSRDKFLRTVANLERYEYEAEDGWTGEMAEDAFEVVNRLIWEANAILNVEAKSSAD